MVLACGIYQEGEFSFFLAFFTCEFSSNSSEQLTICQTWTRLSSAALAKHQGSAGFQHRSVIRPMWPPCLNYSKVSIKLIMPTRLENIKLVVVVLTSSSGGPSCASSGDWRSPIRATSHTRIVLSLLPVAKIASWCGDHASWYISSSWPSISCTLEPRFRKSHSATVYGKNQE